MRYFETDWSPKETKKKIKYYENKGLYIYSLIDTYGTHYNICSKNSMCNRFGFLITDTCLLNDSRDYMSGEEFDKLNPVEDLTLI